MYLARFEFGDQRWVQGCVAFPLPCSSGSDAWSQRLNSLVALLPVVPALRMSYRVHVTPESVSRAIIIAAPQSIEPEVRRLLGLFSRLELLADESVQTPSIRQEHDRLLDEFGRFQALIAVPEYRSRTAWLAFDLRIFESLSRLASQALDLGYTFSYQANLEPLDTPLALARTAAHNLVQLESESGVPAGLLGLQRKVLQRLSDSSYLLDELLGADSEDVVDWLSASLRQLATSLFNLKPPLEFPFEAQGYDSYLLSGRHRAAFDRLTDSELASAAVTSEEAQRLLAWNPPTAFFQIWASRTPTPEVLSMSDDDATIAALDSVPPPQTGLDDYIFISYKRQDMPIIAPILKRIAQRGHRFWYDKGIPGGAEWDAIIEDRVRHCRVLLLFVSQAAIQSRYVRREVRFADALAKPLLCVTLEDAQLAHGMDMLLSQYQMLNCKAPDFQDELERAIQYVRQL
jgi:hypothetical protein